MNLIPTLSTHLFAYTRLDPPMIRLAAERGFRAVEIFAAPQHFSGLDAHQVESVSSELERLEIDLRAIHAPFYESLDDLKARRFFSLGDISPAIREKAGLIFAGLLRAAAALGSPDVVVHAGMRGQDRTDAALYIDAASHLLDGFPEFRGRLLLENTPLAFATMPELAAMAEKMDPDRTGICLDMGHLHLADPADRACSLGEAGSVLRRVRHFHVHDNSGQGDEHLPPGRGTIDWHEALEAISSVPGEAGFSLELRDRSRGRLPSGELLAGALGGVTGPVRDLMEEKGVCF